MLPPFAAFVALVNATCVPEEVKIPMQDSKCKRGVVPDDDRVH